MPQDFTENTTLVLPEALYGTQVSWTSSHEDIINTLTGEVILPTSDMVTVTLTATITVGSLSSQIDFIYHLQMLTPVSILDARELSLGLLVIVEGLITSVAIDANGLAVAFIQDGTAGIYLYKVPAADASKIVVGNMVRVFGTTAVFNELKQISTITKVEVLSSGNPVTPTVVTNPAMISTMQGSFVQVSGYLRQAYTTGSDFFLITDQGTFQLRLVSSSDLATAPRGLITTKMYAAAAGSYVTVVAGVGQFNTTMQIMLFNANDITIGAVGTDAQILAAVVKNTNLPAASNEVIANITLPVSSFLGTTIAWSSSNTDVISNTGVVTRPAANTSNAEVTLTYTITKGTEVFEGTIEFIVLMLEE